MKYLPLIVTSTFILFYSYNFIPSTHALSSLESKGVQTIISPNVDTDPPAWARVLDTTDIRLWVQILPDLADREYDEYMIIPQLGIISPMIYTPTTDPDYQDIVQGRNLNINEYLKRGVHHYPGTSLPGMEGNALIGGHSNYYKDQRTDFTSVFARLPMLDDGDEVWYYRREDATSWMRYVYTVARSYETTPDDVAVFDPLGTGSEMTLYTCVPIGTADNRWIIKTTLQSSQQVYYPLIIESYGDYSTGLDIITGEIYDNPDNIQTIKLSRWQRILDWWRGLVD